jgi:hypothetical protein
MGALVHMRDDSCDTPIRYPETHSEYHEEQLSRAKVLLNNLEQLSPEDVEAHLLADHKRAVASYEKSLAEAKENRRRIGHLQAEIEGWDPPTQDHVGLKELMTRMLEQDLPYEGKCLYPKPTLEKAQAYLEHKIDSAKRDVDYYTKEIAKSKAQHAECVAWIDALKESVGDPNA